MPRRRDAQNYKSIIKFAEVERKHFEPDYLRFKTESCPKCVQKQLVEQLQIDIDNSYCNPCLDTCQSVSKCIIPSDFLSERFCAKSLLKRVRKCDSSAPYIAALFHITQPSTDKILTTKKVLFKAVARSTFYRNLQQKFDNFRNISVAINGKAFVQLSNDCYLEICNKGGKKVWLGCGFNCNRKNWVPSFFVTKDKNKKETLEITIRYRSTFKNLIKAEMVSVTPDKKDEQTNAKHKRLFEFTPHSSHNEPITIAAIVNSTTTITTERMAMATVTASPPAIVSSTAPITKVNMPIAMPMIGVDNNSPINTVESSVDTPMNTTVSQSMESHNHTQSGLQMNDTPTNIPLTFPTMDIIPHFSSLDHNLSPTYGLGQSIARRDTDMEINDLLDFNAPPFDGLDIYPPIDDNGYHSHRGTINYDANVFSNFNDLWF